MRILIVHNYYGSSAPSGENEVVHAEAELLRSNGHEVRLFTRHSDEIRDRGIFGALKGAMAVPWNPFEAHRMAATVRNWAPDIVHAHNIFPLISPSIFSAIPQPCGRVMTLHNYRLLCAAAIPMRDGKPCTDCMDMKSAIPAIVHGCYRSSRIATLPLAAGISLQRARQTWSKDVDAFIALSSFQKELLGRGGLSLDRLHVKPNFYPGRPTPTPWKKREPECVFVGRLSSEKGIVKLVRAWRAWGSAAPRLRIIGDGPLRAELEEMSYGTNIIFTGQIPSQQAIEYIAKARLLILPSECYEGFPMVLREAFAFGTATAVSDLGPLPSLVKYGADGLVLDAFDLDKMLKTLKTGWADQLTLERFGIAGHRSFLKNYTAEANLTKLLTIYGDAIKMRKGKG